MKPNTLFLWGMPGTGKTAFGKKLAQEFRCGFIDLDEWIEEQSSQSIAHWFEIHNEAGFRELESQLLKNLVLHHSTVIACGGGTPCFFDNADWMNSKGLTLWLQPEDPSNWLTERVKGLEKRPVLAAKSTSDAKEKWLKLAKTRRIWYEKAQFFLKLGIRDVENYKRLKAFADKEFSTTL